MTTLESYLARLLESLREARVEGTPEDIVDALWLTQFWSPMASDAGDTRRVIVKPPDDGRGARDNKSQRKNGGSESNRDGSAPGGDSAGQRGRDSQVVDLFPVIDEQAGGTGRGGRLLWAPAPPALTGGLDIARSFRTLKRGVLSRSRSILDTDATIRRIAEEGIWEPVFRPTTDRWLDLALVLDVGPSMDVWRSILDSLRKLLESLGVFGRVKMWSWDTGPVRPLLAPGYGRGGARDWNHNSLELVEAGGRQLILVLTDCVSEAWFSGEATRVLAGWAERGPVAIVQMLPESLWPRTALGQAAQVRLKSPYPAALNRKLAAEFVNPLLIPDDEGTDSVRADSLLIP
ncbi:MAG TPA: SAV_2336 N-terminal domain-related protein, partial [Isosphaeraceae bacterium]|nr:SAV_2336 N-terminal domain-related protein [Isosphaeraceae bacterium]